jgi:tripartite-type tricarboxylate transporter receptor subunit TctC
MNKPHRFRNTAFCFLLAGTLAACSADPDTDTSVDTPTVPLAELHTGPFQILNAFSAVGSSSKTAQIIAPKIEQYLDQPVELVFSQGRTAGVESVADGNAIAMSTIGLMALLPAVMADYPVDPFTDLRPITRTTGTPDLLVVRSDLDINSVQELVDYSTANTGELRYFHIAPASIHRLEWAAFFGELGISGTLDTSRSNGNDDAMAGIIDGTLDMMISTSPYMTELIESGAGVPIAVVNPTRMPLFPDVPTLLELGSESMPSGSWAGVFAPGGTSDEDINRIFEAMQFAMADPEVIAAIDAIGMEINLSESPTEFSSFLQSEIQRLAIAAEQYNFRTD